MDVFGKLKVNEFVIPPPCPCGRATRAPPARANHPRPGADHTAATFRAAAALVGAPRMLGHTRWPRGLLNTRKRALWTLSEACATVRAVHQTVPSWVGARVTYEKVRAANSVLHTRYEQLPSACQPGAFVVLEWFSRAIQMCWGSRELGVFVDSRSARPCGSYALICSTSSSRIPCSCSWTWISLRIAVMRIVITRS